MVADKAVPDSPGNSHGVSTGAPALSIPSGFSIGPLRSGSGGLRT